MPNITTAYNWMIEECNKPNVGYSQAYRNQKTVEGVTYYDCSSMIWYALLEGGFDVTRAYKTATGSTYSGNAIVTATERDWLKALGFSELYAPLADWQAGDILWRSGHTEMVFEGQRTMGAHTSTVSLDQQVSINANATAKSAWSYLYRYETVDLVWIKGNRYLTQSEMQSNARLIFKYFTSKGWSVNAISGMLGNMQKESTINPAIWQDLTPNTGGYGLVQWTPYTNWSDWATAHGYEMDDGYGQLEWIDTNTVPSSQWIPTAMYPMSFEQFKVSTLTPTELADAFLRNFERPSVIPQPERGTYAEYWYNWWGQVPVPPPNPPEKSDRYRTGMPVWMMIRYRR